MYTRILVALENSPSDEATVAHVKQLAALAGSELLLLHVADGWAARNFKHLALAESEEILADRRYLAERAATLEAGGLRVRTELAMGEPPEEILRVAEAEHCDLIVMASHGHRWLGDVLFGSTIARVRHQASMPVLIVRGVR